MRISIATLVVIFFGVSAAAQVQSIYKNDIPMGNVSVGYDRTQANAPPGICNCFGTEGGYASGSFFFSRHLAAEVRASGGTSSNISSLGQNLTLYTFMGGPKVVFPARRLVFYFDALFGVGYGTNSYFPNGTSYSTSATSFALAPGGGIDVALSPRFAIRAVEAHYLHTTFQNGSSNMQNQLQIGAGIVYKFHRRERLNAVGPTPPPVVVVIQPPPPPPPVAPTLACTSDAGSVSAGQAVAVMGHGTPASMDLVYVWNTSGGHILGSGSNVNIDTSGLPPGSYTVTGRIQPSSNPALSASCEIGFAILAPPPPPPVVAPVPAALDPEKVKDFRANVHDVYFDLNKSILRPDGLETIRLDAIYLVAHPDLRILVGGFADQRGSSQYNLALGERRATAVKNKLIERGVSPDNIQLVTFGRDAQQCTAGTEKCWQQNRRVGFLMQP